MTANDILKMGLALMGDSETNSLGYNSDEYAARGLFAVNQILGELCGIEAESLQSEISVSPRVKTAAPWGVAMMLSLGEGDAVRNSVFADIYNPLRAMAKGETAHITDVLPKSEV